MAPSIPSIVRVVAAYAMPKAACIISVGEWGGKKCLFKNRDRNYTPEIKVYHELINGVEVLYMKDEVTGWCEGLNEFGIGIVNAALAVYADEKQGEAGKGKAEGEMVDATLRDGKRMIKALSCKTIEESVDAIKSHLGGLKGHTFVANKDETYSLEATWRGHDYHQRKLVNNRKHVRTNHGQYYQDAGYTEKDGENYLSSLARRDQAMKVMRKVETHDMIAPGIYGKRREDRSDPLNMVKMTDGMRTTSQMVMNLTDLEMRLYLLPGQVEMLGIENNLPEGRTPRLKLEVLEYTDIDDDGVFEIKELEVKPAKKGSARNDHRSLSEVWGKTLIGSEALPGGRAKDKKPSDFDPKELAMGIEVEQEHLVGDGYSEEEAKSIAREIAMDHLTEMPDYYTRLKEMESGAESKKTARRF